MDSAAQPRNQLLRSLSAETFSQLRSHLELVPLKPKRVLHHPRLPIQQVYFIETGLVAVVAPTDAELQTVEGWIIGFEGLAGTPVVLGVPSSPHRRSVQVEGSAWAITSPDLTRAIDEMPELRRVLLRYIHSVLVQTAQVGACNARHPLTARLARWLLMAHDRVESSRIPLTQESVSKLLGVRRASVTEALGQLERTGTVSADRGHIVIRDRAALETRTCHCYRVLRAEFQREFASEDYGLFAPARALAGQGDR